MHNLEFQQRSIESIFLEVLDDLSKKEVLLMVLCYVQLVRRENNFEVSLSDLIRCSEKPHRRIKGDWRDIMMEVDIFYVNEEDKLYEGKDVFKIQDVSQARVSIANIYKPDFNEVSNLITKYWNIVSRLSSFSDGNYVEKKVSTVALLFNEQLYKECITYANMLREASQNIANVRFSPADALFFDAIIDACFSVEFYQKNLPDRAKDYAKNAFDKLSRIETYYDLNLKEFTKQLNLFFKKPQKQKSKEFPKLYTKRHKAKNANIFSRLLNKIKEFFK